ncbi:MAG: hypothetical protein AAGE96_09830 [Cyanobacteria bacterium P01_G01_bin.19]
MSHANIQNDFMTGFASILIIDFFIFFVGIIILGLAFGSSFAGTLSALLVVMIGTCQYIYVVPSVIFLLIYKNDKFAYGFFSGSLSVLSMSVVIGAELQDWFGSFPIII